MLSGNGQDEGTTYGDCHTVRQEMATRRGVSRLVETRDGEVMDGHAVGCLFLSHYFPFVCSIVLYTIYV